MAESADILTDLASLLRPHDPALLHEAVAAGTRLHLHTDRAAAFQALLRWSEVSDLVTVDRALAGSTRVLVNGRDLPLEMFTRLNLEKKRRELRPESLQTLCSKGASLIINHIDMAGRRIAAVTAMIERELNVRSGVNCYVSFCRNSAFPPHWDGHNVLLLQLYGRKQWRCYGQQEAAPVTGKQLTPGDVGEPEWEGELVPGDILYLPRGTIHSGEVTAAHSLHLTIRVGRPQGIDFVDWLSNRAPEVEPLREDLAGAGGGREDDLQAALQGLVERSGLQQFFDDPRHRPPPYRPLNLGLDDPLLPGVWIKSALRSRVELPQAGGFKFESGDFSADLLADECAVLRVLLDCQAAQIGDLEAALPGLPPDAVSEAVANLARKSLVFLLD